MARIAFAWELGTALGHVSGFMPVARKLREMGHEVVLIVRELHDMEAMLDGGFAVVQAPIWLKSHPELGSSPLNYSDILLRHGYLAADGLMPLLRAWLSLWSLLRPDLIVTEYAPTALLSARVVAMPTVLLGTGFCSPPRLAPLPNMRPWQPVPEERLAAIDAHVLGVANTCLAALGRAPLAAMADLFNVKEDFLCTFADLDHYAERGPAHYWGPLINLDLGNAVAWPVGGERRVLLYARPECRGLESLLRALAQTHASVVAYVPGLARLPDGVGDNSRFLLTREPVQLSSLLGDCDLLVCHGNFGTASAALLSGTPLLLLPLHLEHYLFALAAQCLGAAIVVHPDQAAPDYAALLERLLHTGSYAEAARQWAARHAGYQSDEAAARIATRMDELLREVI